MYNEKIIVQVIEKVSNHGKPFAFYDNKGIDYSMIENAFSFCFRELLKENHKTLQQVMR